MEDVADIKFKWRKCVVQKNLNKYYGGINIKELNNYKECGRKHAGENKTNNYFKLLFGKEKPPRDFLMCICGQSIQELCYICPKDNVNIEKIITVGNECIDKFAEISIKGRRCEICGAIHKNRNFNLCNEHKDIKNKISLKYINFINRLITREYYRNKNIAQRDIYI